MFDMLEVCIIHLIRCPTLLQDPYQGRTPYSASIKAGHGTSVLCVSYISYMMSGSSYNSRLISVKWQDFDIHKKDVIHFSLDPVNDQQIRVTMPVKSSSTSDPTTSGENNNTLEIIAKEVPKEEQLVRLHIFTPPFCTNFPHLTVDLSILA